MGSRRVVARLSVHLIVVTPLLLLWDTSRAQTYVLSTVDIPGASQTELLAINDNGELLANAFNNQGVPTTVLYQNGTFSPLPPPPAGDTITAYALNNSGEIAGQLVSGSTAQSFVLSGGTYTTVTIPGSSASGAHGISDAGVLTGNYATSGTNTQAGFAYNPSTGAFTSVQSPGNAFIDARGVTAAGQVIGTYAPASGGDAGFVYDNGTFSSFQVPNTAHTIPQGVSGSGLITGFISVGAVASAFVGNPGTGFQLLSAQGSADTIGLSVNNSGQVAGLYNTSDVRHGFIATPAWLPVGTAANGAFEFDVAVKANSLIYIDPASAVGYQYQTSAGNPNFASVVLPIGIGDNLYSLSLCNGSALGTVAGGHAFTFGSGGVACFDVGGINAAAGLNPADPEAFVTGLTFTGAGSFTGTMDPITGSTSAVPEPSSFALFLLGLVLLGAAPGVGRAKSRAPCRGTSRAAT